MRVWKGTSTLDGLIDGIEIANEKSDSEVLLIGGKKIDLDEFPKLMGIFKTGVGIDNLPFQAAEERGIQIGLPSDSTRDIIFEETASFSCHLILQCLYRNVGDFSTWKKNPRQSLGSKNLLVVGTGNIGRRVCQKMQGLCRVSAFDVVHNRPDEFETLIRDADCVSLHVPMTDQTKQLIDGLRLSWMKDGSAIVNTARGGVIDEDALYDELASGRLFAALDVFWQEPYAGKLKELPHGNVFLTPHIASTCEQFLTETAKDFRSFLTGVKS